MEEHISMATDTLKNQTLPKLSRDAGAFTIDGRLRSRGVLSDVAFEVWDLNQTIPELAYLTHNFFRYYGKFPSVVAAGLLNRFAKPGDLVGDVYCGSGTTLVEASIRGLSAIGIDISPFAVLAANVKTTCYDEAVLRRRHREVIGDLIDECGWDDGTTSLFPRSKKTNQIELTPSSDLDKWFTREAQLQIQCCKERIARIRDEKVREYFALALLAIIRRVSRAFDGEVRPHINKKKVPRDVVSALDKKLRDMIARTSEFNLLAHGSHECKAIQGDVQRLDSIDALDDVRFDLVLSHPPYLNCFDYLPVYKLEFLWAGDMLDDALDGRYNELRTQEVRAWPAKTEEQNERYFAANAEVYRQTRLKMRSGARLCVVIGDSTSHKKLIRVHERFAEILCGAGFDVERIIYRTTHYGTGKYAYDHRADYHDDSKANDEGRKWAEIDRDGGKRDAIIVARAV